jgi:hypothetical protein
MSSSTAESNSTRLALFIFYIKDWKPIYLKDTAQMTGADTISSTLDTYFACVQPVLATSKYEFKCLLACLTDWPSSK